MGSLREALTQLVGQSRARVDTTPVYDDFTAGVVQGRESEREDWTEALAALLKSVPTKATRTKATEVPKGATLITYSLFGTKVPRRVDAVTIFTKRDEVQFILEGHIVEYLPLNATVEVLK